MPPPPLPRDQFPVVERYVYLNHAGIAPIPQVSVDAMHAAAQALVAAYAQSLGSPEGVALSLVFAALTLGLAVNQVAAGLALTILGIGLSGLVGAGFAPLVALALAAKFGLVYVGLYLLSGAVCSLAALSLNRALDIRD